jgi:putative membrane protein
MTIPSPLNESAMTNDEYPDEMVPGMDDAEQEENDILKVIRDKIAEASRLENNKSKTPGFFYEKARLAYEGALMSWIRTAISLISFGFTIYEFFKANQNENAGHLLTPRLVALAMILIGFISLLFAHIQHLTAYKKLRERCPALSRSLSSVFSSLILLFALLLSLAVIFRQ